MSTNPLPKRLLSLVLTICMVLSLVPMSALATGDLNSDSNSDPNTADNAIVNGSFELPVQTELRAPQLKDNEVPGWSTTATDQKIELGAQIGAACPAQLDHLSDKSIPDGKQIAELNADEVSTLYQNVSTVDGHIYEWGLSHRGRAGTDTMALIIGPKQDNAPAKPDKNENGQDQFMRLTDWVQRNAQTLGVTVPTDGCSQRITVYSKQFDENGGFLNNPGNESPFNTAPSNLYTETWSVWIIATGNQSWGSYGTHNHNYDPRKGIGGGIGCSYTVPAGQNETTFAFCSYSSSGSGGLTVGNLLDNITFSLYHNVTFTTTAGGKGTVSAEIQGTTQTVDFSDKNAIDVPVRNNREMTLTAPATVDSKATFVGAYITQHSTSGSSTEFVDKERWSLDGTTYTYTGTVTAPTDVVLVFVQSPAVTYDANGGDRYVYTKNAKEPTDVVSFAADTGRTEYTSHTATARQKNGWVFDGWLLARAENGERVLPAKHTVSYANGVFTFTYKNGTETKETKITANGVALLAQWRWQQTFQTQLQQGDTATDNKDCGTITKDNSDDSVKTYNAATGEEVTVTANAKPGYAFLGWYRTIDGQLQLVSKNQTYAYTVGRQGVQTVYARFAKTYTITYAWDTSNSPKDPTVPTLPNPGTATEGTTYPLFVPQQTTVSATVNDVPGHWLFQGWKEKDGTDYLGQEIANVTKDYTLVGSWSFIPNNQYRLTYDVGNHNTNWIPSGLGAVVQSNPLHYYQENVISAEAPTIPEKEKTILVANGTTFQGTWTFQGWKRSDTRKIVPADTTGTSFTMPNHDLTLTAQWEFTPNVYTVKYDLNNDSSTEEPPASHDSYTYPEIEGKTGVDTSKSGIPFGASVQLKDFPGPAPTGQYFAGWGLKPAGPVAYEPGQNVSNASLGITANDTTVTLYAIYAEKQTITVEFQGNNPQWGAVTNRSGSFTVTDSVAEKTVTSTAKPSPGYHFTGWKCETSEDTKKTETLEVMASQVQTLFKEHPNQKVFRFTAQFEPNSFTVKYNANGGTGTMGGQTFQYAGAGDAYLNPNAFVRPGYRFLGWSETSGKQDVVYADKAKFLGVPANDGATVTLYAQWQAYSSVTIRYTAVPNDLGTVTLNKENQTASAATQETGSPDPALKEIVGATAAAAQGSVFEGWYDQHGTRLSTERRYEPTQVNGLYEGGSYVAHFHAQQYTLRFDANGGEGTMGDLTYTHGQDQSLTKCGFTRAGYDFLGWATAADGNVAYHDQQSLSITQDTTLYAV